MEFAMHFGRLIVSSSVICFSCALILWLSEPPFRGHQRHCSELSLGLDRRWQLSASFQISFG